MLISIHIIGLKLIVHTHRENNRVLIRLRMFTNTKESHHIILSKAPELNLDPTTTDKEPPSIDINVTIFAQGHNKEGDDILEKLVKDYKAPETVRVENFIQETFHLTSHILCKWTQLLYERYLQELQELQDHYTILSANLTQLPDDKKPLKLENLSRDKEIVLLGPYDQPYFKRIPRNFPMLIKPLKLFEYWRRIDDHTNVENTAKRK